MDGIILNIIAYACMALGSYFALDHSIKEGGKLTVFINYVILAWNMFMIVYLIKDYENILSQPLNVRLNFFESITNYLLGFWLLSFKFRKTK
jgi:uncharacterized membrane protein